MIILESTDECFHTALRTLQGQSVQQTKYIRPKALRKLFVSTKCLDKISAKELVKKFRVSSKQSKMWGKKEVYSGKVLR